MADHVSVRSRSYHTDFPGRTDAHARMRDRRKGMNWSVERPSCSLQDLACFNGQTRANGIDLYRDVVSISQGRAAAERGPAIARPGAVDQGLPSRPATQAQIVASPRGIEPLFPA
jgi:hypothetical protein